MRVAYLLISGHLPDAEEYQSFTKQLTAFQAVPQQIYAVMEALGPSTHLMDSLRTALSALATFDSALDRKDEENTWRQSMTLLATMQSAFEGSDCADQGAVHVG